MDLQYLGGILSFVASAAGCWLAVATQHVHGGLTRDTVAGGPQKFNPHPVPRIGGLPIAGAMLLAAGTLGYLGSEHALIAAVLLVAALPALAGGLLEDLTKRVRASTRLLFTFVSAAIAFFVLDSRITGLDVPGMDLLFASAAVSLFFTLFAVGGVANAMNIVDGFNGLFAMCALAILGAIAFVAAQVGDQALFAMALVVAGAVAGFLLFNYPRARLFAGDSGAYLVGFLIAELAVLLVHRNSEVSPWFALTVLAYPVFETFFSMYRKQVVRGRSMGQPDGLHLHMLVYRRVVRWHPASRAPEHRLARNALTSPYLAALCLFGAAFAAACWNSTALLQAGAAAFALAYVWIYRRIVLFNVPRALVLSAPAPQAPYAGEAGLETN